MNKKKLHDEVVICKEKLQIPHLISLNDAAELLSVSARTIRRLSQTGDLPQIVKVGHSARISYQGVVNYISSLNREGATL